jgi:hypothetical protein
METNQLKEIDMTKNIVRGLAMAGVLGGAAAANAAAIDVSALTTDIAAQAAPIGLVGVAVLLIVGAVKAFKWVRAALS